MTWTDYLAPDVPGWFNHPEALLSLVERVRPRRMVEVGTWLGASAIPAARMLSSWGGRLYCVDTWDGSAEHAEGDVKNLFARCAQNIGRYNLKNVTLHRESSANAATDWPFSVNFAYIDASHEEHDVAMDLMGWWAHVLPGGIMAGDDYGNPDYPGVTRAWDWFVKDNRFGEPGWENGAGHNGLVWLYKPVRNGGRQ